MVCLECDHNMIWQNDFEPEDYGLEDIDGVVSVWLCPECDDLTTFLIVDDEIFILGGDDYPVIYV